MDGHQTNIFLEGLSVLSVHAQMVLKILSCSMLKRKIKLQFLLASLKSLTNYKKCSESCIKLLVWLSFA
jgi:hypothetical protein